MPSIWPTDFPVNAPYTDRGFPLPAGWTENLDFYSVCMACEQTCNKRVTTRSLAIPDLLHQTHPSQMGGQDPSLLFHWFYAFMRYVQYLSWLADGHIYSGYALGTGAGNFSSGATLKTTTNFGRILTLDRDYTNNPLDLLLTGDLIPYDPESGDGGYNLQWRSAVQPFDFITYDTGNGLKDAVVVGHVGFGSALPQIEIEKDLDIPDNAEVWWCREHTLPSWPYPAPSRSLFVQKAVTAWISLDDPLFDEGFITLKRIDGTNGRIAWPLVDGMFQVMAQRLDGDLQDITYDYIVDFPSATSKLVFTYNTETGEYETRLYKWGLDTYVQAIQVTFHIEVPDQTDPSAASDNAWRPTQMACKHCVVDPSNRIGSLRGMPWTEIIGQKATDVDLDNIGNGSSWFCDKMAEEGTLINNFTSWCYETRCPFFELNEPWIPNAGDWSRLFMALDIYSEQLSVGDPSLPVLKRNQGPSIFGLAGMAAYTGSSLYLPQVNWITGLNSYGRLHWLTEDEKSETDGDRAIIVNGAFKEDFTGVIEADEYDKTDRLLTPYDAVPAIGDDYEDDEARTPLREGFSISAQAATARAEGHGEGQVQRARRIEKIIPGITLGMNKTIDQDEVLIDVPTGNLVFRMGSYGGVTFDDKSVTGKVNHIQIQSFETIRVEFKPGVVTTWGGLPGGGGISSHIWLCSGLTVNVPNHLRIFNPGCSRDKWGTMNSRLCRGDTIRFRNLGTEDFNDVRLTCLWAKAHAGSLFSGMVGNTRSSALPEGPDIPIDYFDDDFRLRCDLAYFEIPSGGSGKNLVDWIITNGWAAGASVLVDTAAVMAPKNVHYPTSQEVEPFNWIGVKHIQQSRDGSVQEHALLEYTDFNWDAANGEIVIFQATANQWDPEAIHCFEILKDDFVSKPLFFDRTHTLPAKTIPNIQTAIKSLKWIGGGIGSTGNLIGPLNSDWGSRDGGVIMGLPEELYDVGYSQHGELGELACVPPPSDHPAGSLDKETIGVTNLTIGNGPWVDAYYGGGSVNWVEFSAPIGYGWGIPHWGDDTDHRKYLFAVCPVIKVTAPHFMRLTSDLIKQAYIDVALESSSVAENHFYQNRQDPTLNFGIEYGLADQDVAVIGISGQGSFISNPFSVPSDGLWHTVDITEIMKGAAGQTQAAFILVPAAMAGLVGGACTVDTLIKTCVSLHSATWAQDPGADVNDPLYLQEYEIKYRRFSWSNLAMSGVKIQIDHDVLETKPIPHLPFLSGGTGHMPAIGKLIV